MSSKILTFDIETAPHIAYIWRMWKENIGVDQLITPGYMLTWAAKWLGNNKVESATMLNQNFLERLWTLLDKADIVIAHNGIKFDVPHCNTFFLLAGMTPPSTYRTIDTLQVARRIFKFPSNRLDGLGEFLGLGRKEKTEFTLWARCVQGEKKAFKEMQAYNIQDVHLLEAVYLAMRPYMNNHPNVATYGDVEEISCPACGNTSLVKNGYYRTNVSKFQRYMCATCGNQNIRGRTNLFTKEQRANLVTTAR